MSVTRNAGLSWTAQAALAATSLAPVLLVWGAARYSASPTQAGWALLAVLALVGVCLGILALVRHSLQTLPMPVKKVNRLDKDTLSFLVTYALPLISSSGKDTNVFALAVFIVIVGVVLVQLHVLYVNPLLGILGFHFYEIESAEGDVALVLSKGSQAPRIGAVGRRLGPALWLWGADTPA